MCEPTNEPRPLPAQSDAVFDADLVWRLFEGEVERMREVWDISSRLLPASVANLISAVQASDGTAIARHAHSIAGSASHFGAHALVEAARAIERDADRGRIIQPTDVAVIRAELDAVCRAVPLWLERVGAPPGSPVKPSHSSTP